MFGVLFFDPSPRLLTSDFPEPVLTSQNRSCRHLLAESGPEAGLVSRPQDTRVMPNPSGTHGTRVPHETTRRKQRYYPRFHFLLP